jgi:hypothetical protein
MASPLADYVVSLGMDGRVASRGEALDAVTEYISLSPKLATKVLDEEIKVDQEEGPDVTAKQADGKLIVAEEVAEGHVSWDACKLPCPGCSPKDSPGFYSDVVFQGFGWIPRFLVLDIFH